MLSIPFSSTSCIFSKRTTHTSPCVWFGVGVSYCKYLVDKWVVLKPSKGAGGNAGTASNSVGDVYATVEGFEGARVVQTSR